MPPPTGTSPSSLVHRLSYPRPEYLHLSLDPPQNTRPPNSQQAQTPTQTLIHIKEHVSLPEIDWNSPSSFADRLWRQQVLPGYARDTTICNP